LGSIVDVVDLVSFFLAYHLKRSGYSKVQAFQHPCSLSSSTGVHFSYRSTDKASPLIRVCYS
jgi:hypothetical protein